MNNLSETVNQLETNFQSSISEAHNRTIMHSILFLEACLHVENASGLRTNEFIKGFEKAIILLKGLKKNIEKLEEQSNAKGE